MTLDFLQEASEEFYAATEYYEGCEIGLGARFRAEVLDVCRTILEQPFLWRERSGGYRRVNCPVFPYYVAYIIRRDVIVVTAIGHGHRKPDYWRERLEGQ